MKPELDNYDWAEVFGEGSGGNCTSIIPEPSFPDSQINRSTFSREDVEQIIQMEDGDNDGPDWIIYGRLKDGRYFAVRAGCDYTGWDCQAGNSGSVAASLPELIRFGLSDDERKRFRITLDPPFAPAPQPEHAPNDAATRSLADGCDRTGDVLSIVPVTFEEANEFVRLNHRHHKPCVGHKFSLACADTEIRGVAIVGRPVARMADDGWTLEVNRCCTDGTKNACSMLYSSAWRAARAMGYRKLITYTLPSEGGASLRGAGWKVIGEAGGGSWSRNERPRVDMHPTEPKLRWEKAI